MQQSFKKNICICHSSNDVKLLCVASIVSNNHTLVYDAKSLKDLVIFYQIDPSRIDMMIIEVDQDPFNAYNIAKWAKNRREGLKILLIMKKEFMMDQDVFSIGKFDAAICEHQIIDHVSDLVKRVLDGEWNLDPFKNDTQTALK